MSDMEFDFNAIINSMLLAENRQARQKSSKALECVFEKGHIIIGRFGNAYGNRRDCP